ncbi:MAG: VCBS repeat-containing protein [Phycisphaerales bacterium]|nr:VCBS repeat-containing protein [Phycisphaerales bacterium]
MHRFTRTAMFAAASGLSLTAIADAQFTFDPATSVFAGSEPSGIAAADFNGDGIMDLATTTDAPDQLTILFGNGAGGYTATVGAFLGASSSPQDVVAGDLDGDGDMDAAVAVRDPFGSVLILTNTGAGTFTAGATIAVGERPRGMSIADHDGDGDLDIAVANRESNSAHVLTNVGGTFSAATLAAGQEPRATAFGDFDNDGDKDLAVTNHDDRSVSVYRNTGGSFTLAATLFVSPLVRPEGVDTADLDGDGDADLLVATSDQTLGINEVAVFMSTGAVAFSGPTGYATGGTNTSQIVAADLDCDGVMDAAVVSQDSNNVSLLRGNGAGGFMAPQIMTAGTRPGDIVAADLDGDGDADLAVENRDSNNVSVFMNQTCTGVKTPGDVDGDGDVDFTDLLQVLADWGPCPGCAADLDGDGSVGFTDLLEVLAGWTA